MHDAGVAASPLARGDLLHPIQPATYYSLTSLQSLEQPWRLASATTSELKRGGPAESFSVSAYANTTASAAAAAAATAAAARGAALAESPTSTPAANRIHPQTGFTINAARWTHACMGATARGGDRCISDMLLDGTAHGGLQRRRFCV